MENLQPEDVVRWFKDLKRSSIESPICNALCNDFLAKHPQLQNTQPDLHHFLQNPYYTPMPRRKRLKAATPPPSDSEGGDAEGSQPEQGEQEQQDKASKWAEIIAAIFSEDSLINSLGSRIGQLVPPTDQNTVANIVQRFMETRGASLHSTVDVNSEISALETICQFLNGAGQSENSAVEACVRSLADLNATSRFQHMRTLVTELEITEKILVWAIVDSWKQEYATRRTVGLTQANNRLCDEVLKAHGEHMKEQGYAEMLDGRLQVTMRWKNKYFYPYMQAAKVYAELVLLFEDIETVAKCLISTESVFLRDSSFKGKTGLSFNDFYEGLREIKQSLQVTGPTLLFILLKSDLLRAALAEGDAPLHPLQLLRESLQSLELPTGDLRDGDPWSVVCKGCALMTSVDVLMICGQCHREAWHTFCLTPPLEEVPDDHFHCPTCVKREQRRVALQ